MWFIKKIGNEWAVVNNDGKVISKGLPKKSAQIVCNINNKKTVRYG